MSYPDPSISCPSPSDYYCVEANPDIAGIGVRSSIYFQALLSIVYTAITIWGGPLTFQETRVLGRISFNITLTACALLISAIIQNATLGISLYHMLIILQLSWINSLIFMVVFIVSISTRLEHAKATGPTPDPRYAPEDYVLRSECHRVKVVLRTRDTYISSIHFSVVGALGFRVWFLIDFFGCPTKCNTSTFLVILLRDVYVTPAPVVQKISLALYGIAVLPIGNLLLLGILLFVTCSLIYVILTLITAILAVLNVCLRAISTIISPHFLLDSEHSAQAPIMATSVMQGRDKLSPILRFRFMYYSIISGIAIAMIIMIMDTELMIHRSSNFVAPGEGQWTFGQTFSMLLLVSPLWEIFLNVRKKYFTKSTNKNERTSEGGSAPSGNMNNGPVTQGSTLVENENQVPMVERTAHVEIVDKRPSTSAV